MTEEKFIQPSSEIFELDLAQIEKLKKYKDALDQIDLRNFSTYRQKLIYNEIFAVKHKIKHYYLNNKIL